MRRPADDDLFFDARVHLDRVVDPDPEHDRESGDRDDRERNADVAGDPERPHDTGEDDDQRQEPPPHAEQQDEDEGHDRDGDAAEREHAAGQVVVDVLQQHRRAGGDNGRVVETKLLRRLRDEVGRNAFVLDRLVAVESRHHLRMTVVDEERVQGLADLALVVMDEEVGVRGIVEGPLIERDRGQPRERLRRIGGAGLLAGRRRLPVDRRECDPPRDALRRVAGGALEQRVVVLESRQRAHDVRRVLVGAQLRLDRLPESDVLRGEQLGDSVTGVHGDEREHRLTAEQVLIRDAVLVDLVTLVEIAVLTGRELELGDAVAESDRQHRADRQHDNPVLSEIETEP